MSESKSRFDIVMITTDQHRADYVGFGVDSKIPTPNLDRIAEGCMFERCNSINPVCAPARAGLLTGKYAHQVGMHRMAGDLSLQNPTFARALQGAGYYTGMIGKTHWLQSWQFNKKITPRGQGINYLEINETLKRFGFDVLWNVSGKELSSRNHCAWCEHLKQKGILEEYRDFLDTFSAIDMDALKMPEVKPWPFDEEDNVDVVTGDHAVSFVQEAPDDQPLFLHASFCGPHKPLDPPPSFIEKAKRVLADCPRHEPIFQNGDDRGSAWLERRREWLIGYVANILIIDQQVGRLLDALENRRGLESTVLLFSTDHGEMLGDFGEEGKSRPQWQACRIPAAIRHPEYLDANRFTCPVELTDFTATILDVAGLNPQKALSRPFPAGHQSVPCKSLLPLLRGETEQIREMAFSACNDWRMVESPSYKYIKKLSPAPGVCPQEHLYDLDNDPLEKNDLSESEDHQDVLNAHKAYMDSVMDSTPPAQYRWAPFAAYDISHELP